LRLPVLPSALAAIAALGNNTIARNITEEADMKRFALLSLLFLALATGCDIKLGPMPPVEVYFSPKGGCTDAVVRELDSAKQTVFVQAYSFTSREIAAALNRAKERGVVVHVILDKTNIKESSNADADIARHGISVLVDSKHSIAHNKVIIIDSQVVVTGSFNFTEQAEHSNAENLLVIHDPALAERYLSNWHDHEAHSQPYAGRGEVAERPTGEQRRTKAR
jgi:phosphatidylserine/phosphatidylglycerophosphate/cardiolipin synthase-like enzyme